MTFNINTDIDLNIRKLDELIKKLELAEDKSNMLTFITLKDFCKMRKCSPTVGQRIFRLDSFPSENFRKRADCRTFCTEKLV